MNKKKKKNRKAVLGAVVTFSLIFAVTVVVSSLKAADNARKRLEEQSKSLADKLPEQSIVEEEKDEQITTPAEPTISPQESVEKEEKKEDEFAPLLEECIISPPAEGKVYNSYSGSALVYSEFFDDWRVHKGIDITATENTEVRAVANGRVKAVYKDNIKGNTLEINHGDFVTKYSNLSDSPGFVQGQEIYADTVIGRVGKWLDGTPLLHFEIEYKGEGIDPEPLITR